jgi:hypothetical protein
MDPGCEAPVGFFGAQRDALELLELAEEVFDKVTSFVPLLADAQRPCPARVLGDDDLGAALVQFGDDRVAVESLVGDQRVKLDAIDQGSDAYRVEALSRQSTKRTRLPSASARVRILVVIPPFERPMAWL